MLPVDDARSLPLLYHLNSEPWLNLEAYMDPANEPQFKALESAAKVIALPPASSISDLSKLFEARYSCRRFERRRMPLGEVGEILTTAYGIVKTTQTTSGGWSCTRPVPSAGGLYPLEPYVALANVEAAGDGLYHYNVLHHQLELMREGQVIDEIGEYLLDQRFLQHANAIVFLSAVFERTMNKYGPRGYRYILLEAGHCAQNICLLAAERGLGVICIGGFYDGRLNHLLDLDGKNEAVVYCIGIGYSA